jgi:hypothetical protein
VVFGPKVSSGNGVRMEPILNLRMFLSAKGLLGRITNLRSSSGILKPQLAWYLTRERERAQHLGCWSHRICSEGEEKPLRTSYLKKVQKGDRQIWKRCRRVILEAFRSSVVERSGIRWGINF